MALLMRKWNNSYAYVEGNPVRYTDPSGQIGVLNAVMVIGGAVWATYQGYEAGQQYARTQCATKTKFNERAANSENWTPAQEVARRAEEISNGISLYGPIALRGIVGVAVAGAGGSFIGAGIAMAGATYGFYAGQENCTCR